VLDRIIFVSRHGRITQEERESMQLLYKEFGTAIKDISVCCITHAEDMDEEERLEEIQKFQSSDDTKDIANLMSDVLMCGIKQYSAIRQKDLQDSKQKYKDIGDRDAIALRNFILKNKYQIKFNYGFCSMFYGAMEKIDIGKK